MGSAVRVRLPVSVVGTGQAVFTDVFWADDGDVHGCWEKIHAQMVRFVSAFNDSNERRTR